MIESIVSLILLLLGSMQTTYAGDWTIYITNDNCPDYTWGFTEEQTRKSFADIVRAHLDQMSRTDGEELHNRDRYNMAVTQEALCFVEYYPQRKAELIRRINEGQVLVSPYLCNSLWAFQSIEGAVRTFYPARRLERDWGISIDVAEHIEEPSLPWGTASILAGCGIRWLSVPFYSYDSTFSGLKNPPLFFLEGPDGSRIRVVMDPYACNKASYMQGQQILRNPESVTKEWLVHYTNLGSAYPLRAILASGTHGDISPSSGSQARGFAESIIKYNSQQGLYPKLVNAALPQFCRVVDDVQAKTPFMPTLRGCFGHSWDLWPASLAKYVADMRQAERTFLAAEALVSVASLHYPQVLEQTRNDREQAEWYWSMLSDHAWNGNSEANKLHNAELRKKWSEQFNRIAQDLMQRGWEAIDLNPDNRSVTVFNSLSFPRRGLVRIVVMNDANTIAADGQLIPCQTVQEEGECALYFVAPEVPAFSLRQFQLSPTQQAGAKTSGLSSTTSGLESPFYRLSINPRTGTVSSLVHKASGQEICTPGSHGLCQTVFFDGREHRAESVKAEVVAEGPVLARMKITGMVQDIEITSYITLYAELDQVDFDSHIHKPVTTQEQRLCHMFPILSDQTELRIETPGAVIRPRPQPQGDLLPGADMRRFAVQGFADASAPNGLGVTIAPLDAYALRLDLGLLTFEALGNDQNYREVTQDQGGVTDFRFRYVLRGYAGGYRNAETVAWSRSVMTPLASMLGHVAHGRTTLPAIQIDRSRAIATCLKSADDSSSSGVIVRLWETAGGSEPVRINLTGYSKAIETDLLERDRKELPVTGGHIEANVNPNGLCGFRLLPGPRIIVDVAKKGEPISKYVYGQFIEHLGQCIYGGIWAEMLEDRKFYYPVGAENSPWKPLGDAKVEMDRRAPFAGEQSPQISAPGGIAQGSLGLVEGKEYTGTIWLKGDTGIQGVDVSLLWGDSPDQRQTITVKKLTSTYSGTPLRFPCAGSSNNGRLEIVAAGAGQFNVGTVSLMPADNVEGMRADTLELLKELNSPIYRWPGGNFVSGYDWRDGIGERDRRPPRPNLAWPGQLESNDFGIDEFMTFCRLLETEPYIAVNSGFGDAHSAVEEVEYVNGSPDTPMGRQRAANGHPEPYNVKWWGIGNEMYGDWQLGHMSLDHYVHKHNRFAAAMRKADPSIKIVGVGDAGAWSEGMLKSCAGYMDLISEHFYCNREKEVLAEYVSMIRDNVRHKVTAHRDYRSRLDSLKDKDIRVAIDEWNYWYGPRHYNMKDAMGIAAGLHEMFRSSDIVFMANYAQTVNVIGAIKTSKTAAAFDTTGLVLQLYRNRFGLAPVEITGADLPLDMAAALGSDGKKLTIAVVNPTEGEIDLPLEVKGARLSANGGHRWHIAHPDPMAYNEPGKKPRIRIEQTVFGDGAVKSLKIPAISVCLYELPLE